MSEELKACPWCGSKAEEYEFFSDGIAVRAVSCSGDNDHCDYGYLLKDWQTRPTEDALRARIADLEAENERLNKRAEYLEEQTRKACHLATTERADDLAQSYLAYWDDIHAERAELRDACKHALMFIVNGIACGRIELPDPALGDKANDTEGLLRSVLERYSLS